MVKAAPFLAVVPSLVGAFSSTSYNTHRSLSSLGSYLDNLSGQVDEEETNYGASYLDSLRPQSSAALSSHPPSQPTSDTSSVEESTGFYHAPLNYFAFDNLSSKGPRATCDWGTPQDWSRKLADDGVFRAGTWYCSEGGWESPTGKAVTEVFYMLEGSGMLGDSDG